MMDVTQLHQEMLNIDSIIDAHGLISGACVYINWVGEDLRVGVEAREPFDEKGYWESEKTFSGPASAASALVAQAREWAEGLPCEEDRAAELMIRRLNEIADKLPAGSNDIAAQAWDEFRKLLLAKADRIAKSGLPSPSRITDLPRQVAP